MFTGKKITALVLALSLFSGSTPVAGEVFQAARRPDELTEAEATA